jgi:hypothetical protein
MFPLHLQANEVKNAAGTEVEFLRFDGSQPRKIVFHKSGEAPNLREILEVSHLENGTGFSRRRRSRVGFRVEHLLSDGITPGYTLGYSVFDIPVGGLADFTKPTLVAAYMNSLCASQGATTTILYDGTGYGAAALINGTT